ncbi:MAG: type II secretion system protein GspH [Methylobacter sp.]|nr:MAG: type II secretion system protein GspH [Methylobacter sp.]PPD21398.1 MAG: type II secretion system protein GspH [Methylobacter sp.]PPD37025.1 MAG: type II secretion system protein GspH [Methylomonas sp.]
MSRSRGFTLIEVLITLVLIGVVTGMAFLSMGNAGPRDQQKLEAERLLRILELASQEAVAGGKVIGVEFFSKGYRFAELGKKDWQPELRDDIFRPRTLTPPVQLALSLGKADVKISSAPVRGVPPKPQIFLTPDGDMALFRIQLAAANSASVFTLANTAQDGLVLSSAGD